METHERQKKSTPNDMKAHEICRNATIASHIRDVIQDYKILAKEKNTDTAGKYKRSEVQPPNTSNIRQHNLVRSLTELGDKLRKEVEQCNENELVMQKRLEEVAKMTSDLAEKFLEAEMAYNGVLKEREAHEKVVNVFSKELEDYDKTSKRYARAGTALNQIRVIVEKAINANKCYTEFVKSLAGSNMSSGAGSHALAEFIAEFETIESANNTITERMNDALSKAEKSQMEVMQIKNAFIRELKFTIEGLITSHSAMEHAGIMNERYEKALNTMSIDAVGTMTSMVKVLNSSGNMIENLIKSKTIDHSYRKKTLAQQFEAIRNDYVKKKAILHEYHKSKAKLEKKRLFMVKAFDHGERLQKKMDHQKLRLQDLARKRVKGALVRRQELELKKEKRLQAAGLLPLDIDNSQVEEVYNPLEQPLAVVDLEEEEERIIGKASLRDQDDFDDGSDTDEGDGLALYSGPARDSLMIVESEEQASFMMTAESDVSEESGDIEKASMKRQQSRMSVSSTSSGASDSSDLSRDKRMSAIFRDSLFA